MPLEEPTYEPLGRPKRRRRGDCAIDSQGQLVEYERGYLRHQAKVARGVASPEPDASRRRARSEGIHPAVDPGSRIEIIYVLDLDHVPRALSAELPLELWWRGATAGGAGASSPLRPLCADAETTVPTERDCRLLSQLWRWRERGAGVHGNRFLIPPEAQSGILAQLGEMPNLRWSARRSDGAWRLHRLAIRPLGGKSLWSVSFPEGPAPQIMLSAMASDLPFEQWQALSSGGWAMAGGCIYFIGIRQAFGVLAPWIGGKPPALTPTQRSEFIRILTMDGGADLDGLPETLRIPVESLRPGGRLYVTTARFKHLGAEQLQCELSFDYAGTAIPDVPDAPMRVASGSRVLERDPHSEEALRQRLRDLGFRLVKRAGGDEDPGWKLPPAQLEKAVFTLVSEGWRIHASGKDYRRPVDKNCSVSSFGIDWLEINARVDFGNGLSAQLPELLRAIRTGSRSVLLDDGSYGILPQDWLEHFTVLTQIGRTSDRQVLLRKQHAGMLQALLDRQVDDLDGRYHEVLAGMEAENAAAPPPFAPPEQFLARLRPYQNAGAAWLSALARRGLNGILADDMGLGKTVEVLAVLAARHFEPPRPPSLIVAPSSLLFNWQQESARFAPFLKVSQYHGPHRKCDPEWFSRFDLVLTTYGTLRQDAARLAAIDFDCVVLDESQNIKNAQSLTAQSARVLKASRRIAMTGTPIENHLSELFSQLSFLNPGLFTAPLVQALGKEGGVLRDPGTARRMQRCLQPFILRRTKEQVATDLPAKTEQVIGCELPPEQRRHYDELREYYRQELSGMAGGQPGGGGAATMLAALLRLRQAACHAALIDPAMQAVPSAKLQLLHDHLGALLESGHKALVFSQFTSLLKLAAKDFDCSGWKYCYLDGTTRDRGELVQRFQGDSSVGIFLISLKAGGVGLNLTAADYVYLLDPWWNPAAEAQAIDRAYRIGQRRPVFAYRLIARDTVEEKVMIMQRKKRAIANAVISAVPQDALDAPPPSLTAEDLRSLLDLG